jgi:hypothetical protein
MDDQATLQLTMELDRCDVNPEVFAGETGLRIEHPLVVALIGIRLHPILWPLDGVARGARKRIGDAILRILRRFKPVDGGAWVFYNRLAVPSNPGADVDGEIMISNVVVTSVCWATLLLSDSVSVYECDQAFRLVTDCLVTLTQTDRPDIIALNNMLFFVLLFLEKYQQVNNGRALSVTAEVKEALTRARDTIYNVLTLEDITMVNEWLHYYVPSEGSSLGRIAGFVATIVFRWPENKFLDPLKYALASARSRLEETEMSSFQDACMFSFLQADDGERAIYHQQMASLQQGMVDLQPERIVSLSSMLLIQSKLFPLSCLLAALVIPWSHFKGYDFAIVTSAVTSEQTAAITSEAAFVWLQSIVSTYLEPSESQDESHNELAVPVQSKESDVSLDHMEVSAVEFIQSPRRPNTAKCRVEHNNPTNPKRLRLAFVGRS